VGQDSDFSADQFRIRYKTDLGNDLGNLLNRLLNMGGRYSSGAVPAFNGDGEAPEQELRALWAETAPKYLDLAAGYQFHTALEALWVFIRAMNRYVENRAPWKLGKSEDAADRARLENCLAHIAEGLRLTAVALSPIMPGIAAAIQTNIGLTPVETFAGQLEWSAKAVGAKLAEKAILFPPIEEPVAG
jgi:methionyl-tRNA synthetase